MCQDDAPALPPDPGDRLVDEMLSFLRGGPLPEPTVGATPDAGDDTLLDLPVARGLAPSLGGHGG
jgi:hypothetical protein